MMPAKGVEPPAYALRYLCELYIRAYLRTSNYALETNRLYVDARQCTPMHAEMRRHYSIAMAQMTDSPARFVS